MNALCFDLITRRASLLTLGAAGLATFTASAKKKHKHKKPTTSKQAKQKCQRQAGQCTTFFAPICDGDPGCTGQVKGCCALAGSCDVVGFYYCLTG